MDPLIPIGAPTDAIPRISRGFGAPAPDRYQRQREQQGQGGRQGGSDPDSAPPEEEDYYEGEREPAAQEPGWDPLTDGERRQSPERGDLHVGEEGEDGGEPFGPHIDIEV